MRTLIFCDFDGTATDQDAQQAIMTHFTGDAWRPINRAWTRGEVTTAHRAAVQWGLVQANTADVQRFVIAAVDFTPGFREFARWCRDQGHALHILSDGFDLYIDPLLAREGLADWPRTVNHLTLDGGEPRFRFQHQDPACDRCGNCKRWVIQRAREAHPGARVVYLGDGVSDLCPAQAADVVLARRALLARCRETGLSCHPFDDFCSVRAVLESL
ncbi:MAG: MtnX-like HAD-IB family phosphatase [Chloroflexi bacterium]|nr:MtnX-like HAD-IB family phosphatase [Chloroflexota bacterium]MBU1750101.1 MtnX-like HAD-IB family phosphatase [Chloroflexota bacterium]MBU1879541.1 MtnX-like HAD-IB family phosphatase [Chloroflexota bacterium]